MTSQSLTHEQKVEKLLCHIVASQGLLLACLLNNSGLPRSGMNTLTESFEDISSACAEIVSSDS